MSISILYCARGSTKINAAICEYGEDSLRGAIESYMGKMIPSGPLSKRLEDEFSHRVIGLLVQSKRPASDSAGNYSGGQRKFESPSKRRAM